MDTQSKPIAKEGMNLLPTTPASTKQVVSAKNVNGSKTADSMPYTVVTEATMREALIEARADIFIASQLLGITAIRLNRAIQVSPTLQATLDAIPRLSKGVTTEELHHLIEQRVVLYRASGLDALHELATMPVDENSAQNQVKLAAAARLAGTVEAGGGSGELEQTLRELNHAYQEHAPRLRVTREKTTIETLPAERVVSEVPKASE